MEFRNIVIANAAKLSIQNDQLCIAQKQEVTIPFDDISALMIESRQVLVTSAVMERLASEGITVFFCDEKHLPSAQLLAYHPFRRKKKMLFAQFSLPKPVQKQLWQSIVRQKIKNQSACLRLAGMEGADELENMAARVHSGDPGNVEAVAAAFYFRKLFGDSFTRDAELLANAALNYGYAIIRGAMARNLVMHGLDPAVGLHHCSELNAFNLADDLMEPFRPVVDLYVVSEIVQNANSDELTPQHKRNLFNITNLLVQQMGKKYRTMIAIDRAAASLAASILSQKNQLELSELLPIMEGRFE